jgi:hypothetical protein
MRTHASPSFSNHGRRLVRHFNVLFKTKRFPRHHDQNFEQTTQFQYQFEHWKKLLPFVSLTWRYDSGAVAGAVTDYATARHLHAGSAATDWPVLRQHLRDSGEPIRSCSSPDRGALRVRIPADGTENDDTNPPRIAPRHLFDLSVGTDNLFRGDKTKISLRFTAVNITNKMALYNFLSTFSGTHFVTPRTLQVQAGISF